MIQWNRQATSHHPLPRPTEEEECVDTRSRCELIVRHVVHVMVSRIRLANLVLPWQLWPLVQDHGSQPHLKMYFAGRASRTALSQSSSMAQLSDEIFLRCRRMGGKQAFVWWSNELQICTHTQLLVRSLRVNFADVNHGLLNVRKRQKRAFLQGRCLESCGRPKLPDAITIDGRL